MSNSPPRTAFVLAGGGSLGAVEVGMLHALTEHGLRPDFVVGASAGAINGVYFASDPTPRGVAKLDQLWRGLMRRPVDASPYDYSACATLIDRATLTTRAWIAAGGLDKPCGAPDEMHEHSHA